MLEPLNAEGDFLKPVLTEFWEAIQGGGGFKALDFRTYYWGVLEKSWLPASRNQSAFWIKLSFALPPSISALSHS